MKIKFLKADYKINFEVPKDFLKVLNKTFPVSKKNSPKIAIYSSIQFLKDLPKLSKLLIEAGYTPIFSKPFRTKFEGQILGCDSYPDSLKLNLDFIEGFIYIGDGYFHPNALLLSQENETKIKSVLILNVVQQIVEVISKSHIEKYLKKKKGNLLKFYSSENIGVFVSSKWGQEYMDSALKLKEKFKDKNFYFFIADNFLDSEFENFPKIDCWVNTACPRIGQDDILRHTKAVINIKDIWE